MNDQTTHQKTRMLLTAEMPDSILTSMLTELQIEQLKRGAEELGVILDEFRLAKFARFASMLDLSAMGWHLLQTIDPTLDRNKPLVLASSQHQNVS